MFKFKIIRLSFTLLRIYSNKVGLRFDMLMSKLCYSECSEAKSKNLSGQAFGLLIKQIIVF